MFKDLPAVKHYCQRLNSGEMYSLLAAILTNRSWDDIKDPSLGSLHAPNTKQEKTLIRTCEGGAHAMEHQVRILSSKSASLLV